MPAPTATTDPGATSLDHSDESATSALYRAAIGLVNTDYYLPIFSRFEAADRAGPSWNWAASLYTLNWLVFRRLWGAALVYIAAVVGAALTLLGIGRLIFQYSEATELGLLAALIALGFVVPGLYGNTWLHAASRKKMARALAESATMREACARLNQQASSRRRFIWQALANGALAGAAAAAYLAAPSVGSLPLRTPQGGAVQFLAPNQASSPATDASALTAVPVLPASAPPLIAPPTLGASASAAVANAASPAAAPVPPAQPAAQAPDKVLCTDCLHSATLEKPNPSASAPATAQRFYINVGLFAVSTNARNAHAKLLDAGLTAYTQELQTAKGKRTRVRVGPLQTRLEADAVADKIRALLLDAVVLQQ